MILAEEHFVTNKEGWNTKRAVIRNRPLADLVVFFVHVELAGHTPPDM